MKIKYNGIAIFGEIGSGKDTFAEELQRANAKSAIYQIGKLCRDIMRAAKVNTRWLMRDRELGQSVGDKLRELDSNLLNDYVFAQICEKFSGWYPCGDAENATDYQKRVSEQLAEYSISELPIVVGGRTIDDLKYWRNLGFLIVGITSDSKKRESRVACRGNETNSASTYSHHTETDAKRIIKEMCDVVVENNQGTEELLLQAEQILHFYFNVIEKNKLN